MTHPTESVERLAELASKATPGPWHYGNPWKDGCVRHAGFYKADTEELSGEIHSTQRGHLLEAVWHNDSTAGLYGREEDARFIAACSPEVIASLVSEVLEARKVVEETRHLVADALAVRDGGVRDGLSIEWASINKTRDALSAYDDARGKP